MVEVARGADLINALLRTRLLAGTAAVPFKLAELTPESVWGCLPSVFFDALALKRGGAALEVVALTDDEVESELLFPPTRVCIAEKPELAESGSLWLLSSELRRCSGDTRVVGLDGSGSSLEASTVALEFGDITAAVSSR